mmetsp:Transcript_15039/g.29553  ORF Transcript_15039/g.29553 Transcript_15039/m.29553 type:complete len:97 (+) Transcript_15039:884-1174(+)
MVRQSPCTNLQTRKCLQTCPSFREFEENKMKDCDIIIKNFITNKFLERNRISTKRQVYSHVIDSARRENEVLGIIANCSSDILCRSSLAAAGLVLE